MEFDLIKEISKAQKGLNKKTNILYKKRIRNITSIYNETK